MTRNVDEINRAMSIAGKSIRLKLKRIYGSASAAEAAISRKAEGEAQSTELEHWASLMAGEIFRFSDLPQAMREKAKLSMACAYLVWEHEQSAS